MNNATDRVSRRPAKGRRAAIPFLLCLGVILTSACAADEPDPLSPDSPGSEDSALQAIVSDPVSTDSRVPFATALNAPAAAPGSEIVYLSLSPGSLDRGTEIDVRNRGSSVSVLIPITDGGFDPLPIVASVGDILDLVVSEGSLTIAEWSELVPPRRPPVIVRTNPARGKRDVPVASAVQVVFSEPIDGASVAQGTIVLFREDGAPVPGLVTLDADGLIASFAPAMPLWPDTGYELIVGLSAADLDGDALAAPMSTTFTTMPGEPPSRIAFVMQDGLFVMDADGSNLQKLATDGPLHWDERMDWSPDGTMVAFEHEFEIWVMQADGSGKRLLAGRPEPVVYDGYTYNSWIGEPAWSPDGSRLAFVGTTPLAITGIWVMNADGSGATQLSSEADLLANPCPYQGTGCGNGDYSPTWSPDGTRIAFERNLARPDGQGLFVMNADGSGVAQLTIGNDRAPEWSPDGTQIVFVGRGSGWDGCSGSIQVVDPVTAVVTRVTDCTGSQTDAYPSWSPSGSQLVFERRWPARQIFVARADGSRARRIGPALSDMRRPVWFRLSLEP